MSKFISRNWFRLAIVFIFITSILLISYYFFIFMPKYGSRDSLAPIEHQVLLATTTPTAYKTMPAREYILHSTVSATSTAVEQKNSNVITENLLDEIMDRVVYVKCVGDKGIFSGSGTTQLIDSLDPVVITNFHLVSMAGGATPYCKINIPQPPDYSLGLAYPAIKGIFDTHYSDNDLSSSVDVVVLHIQDVAGDSLKLFKKFPLPFCTRDNVEIGDNVAVLGYPAFGEQLSTDVQSLTVTNGIISGFIKNQFGVTYKTSAKFDHGVSGGLAINNSKKCVLGIPTWINYGSSAQIGIGDTMGLIQSWDSIKNSGGIFLNADTPLSSPQTYLSAPEQPAPTPPPQDDKLIGENYYKANHTCIGIYGNQYSFCLTYAYNH